MAPHPDDEILGLGGTMKKLSDHGHNVVVLLVAGHLPPLYSEEVFVEHKKQALEAHKIVGVKESIFLEIPATFVKDETVADLNGKIYKVVQSVKPNVVFMPFPDRHIDHKLIFESTLVATRPLKDGKNIELVAAYETLSETHWNAPYIEPNFVPNFVIDISMHIDKKIEALKCYKSQITLDEGPRSIKSIKSLATFRGTQSGFDYGEAFYIIRMTA